MSGDVLSQLSTQWWGRVLIKQILAHVLRAPVLIPSNTQIEEK
jgi:hypothetical protein